MLVAGALVVGRIEAMPARPWNIDLGPRMGSAMLTLRHLDVSGDEPCGKTPMPGGFHHENREVAARTAAERERVAGQLNSRLGAVGILERPKDMRVQLLEELERANDLARLIQIGEPASRPRTGSSAAGTEPIPPAPAADTGTENDGHPDR